MDTPKDPTTEQKPAETTPATPAPTTPEATPVPTTEPAAPTQPGQPVAVEPAVEPVPPKIESFLQQPHAQKPISSDSGHTKSFMTKLLVLVVIVLFLIAGALAYIISSSKKTSPSAAQQNTQAVAPTTAPTPTPDPMADWKTYTGKNFSIKYPTAGWLILEDKGPQVKHLVDGVYLTNKVDAVSPLPGGSDKYSQLSIALFNSDMPSTFPKTSQIKENDTIKPVNVGTYTGIRGMTYKETGNMDVVYLKNPAGGYVSLEFTRAISSKEGDEAEKVFDEMLSSFKFIDSTGNLTPTVSISISPTTTISPVQSTTP